MDAAILERHFARMGARVKTREAFVDDLRINVLSDKQGEYFDLRVNRDHVSELFALNIDPADQHLLLLAKTQGGDGSERKHRFLCGHDERAWFVASVAGNASTVRQAKEALKPQAVRMLQERLQVRQKYRHRRKNEAFIRQGEWFFIPQANMRDPVGMILRDEPIQRGAGKPHLCEFLVRTGGQTVYVSRGSQKVLTVAEYARLLQNKPGQGKKPWKQMRQDMLVYVKGRIRHPDHKTVTLSCWHQVLMNTEAAAPGVRHVAFLD